MTEMDDEEFNRLKREFLALDGISPEVADSLEVANVKRNENGLVIVSFVAKDGGVPFNKLFSKEKD
jgi:hypothetical protein